MRAVPAAVPVVCFPLRIYYISSRGAGSSDLEYNDTKQVSLMSSGAEFRGGLRRGSESPFQVFYFFQAALMAVFIGETGGGESGDDLEGERRAYDARAQA